MNINKHLILLFSVLFFLFAVSVSSGCFRKNESDVKSVVRNELDQLKNLDSETTQKYIPYTELFPDATENTDLTDEINETFSLFFRKFNYKISIPKFLPEILKQNFSGHRSQSQPRHKKEISKILPDLLRLII